MSLVLIPPPPTTPVSISIGTTVDPPISFSSRCDMSSAWEAAWRVALVMLVVTPSMEVRRVAGVAAMSTEGREGRGEGGGGGGGGGGGRGGREGSGWDESEMVERSGCDKSDNNTGASDRDR